VSCLGFAPSKYRHHHAARRKLLGHLSAASDGAHVAQTRGQSVALMALSGVRVEAGFIIAKNPL